MIFRYSRTMFKTSPIRNKKCCICSKRAFSDRSRYCLTCARFAFRMKARQFPPWVVKKIWEYVRKYGYVCYYTGMALDMNDPTSPWYCFLNHWRPGDMGKVVITSALINVMKGALTEDEFWYYIEALADYKDKGKPIRKKRPVFWNHG